MKNGTQAPTSRPVEATTGARASPCLVVAAMHQTTTASARPGQQVAHKTCSLHKTPTAFEPYATARLPAAYLWKLLLHRLQLLLPLLHLLSSRAAHRGRLERWNGEQEVAADTRKQTQHGWQIIATWPHARAQMLQPARMTDDAQLLPASHTSFVALPRTQISPAR